VTFWRITFWVTAIHFVCFGYAFGIRAADQVPWSMLAAFHPKDLGYLKATALWVFENNLLVANVLILTDAPALYLAWNLARRDPKIKRILAYLVATLAIAGAYVVAGTYAASVGTFSTSHARYRVNVPPLIIVWGCLLLAIPALVILAGSIIVGWGREQSGLCRVCGYDLRATPDRCPECGTIPTDSMQSFESGVPRRPDL
jgi:hypothetical protein